MLLLPQLAMRYIHTDAKAMERWRTSRNLKRGDYLTAQENRKAKTNHREQTLKARIQSLRAFSGQVGMALTMMMLRR